MLYPSASNYNPAARKDDGSCAFMCVVDEPDTIGMTDLYAADATRRKRKLGLVKQMAEKRACVAARASTPRRWSPSSASSSPRRRDPPRAAGEAARDEAPPQAKSAASKRHSSRPPLKKKIAAAVARTPAGKKEMAAKRELGGAEALERPQDDRVQKKLAAKMSKPAARHH